MRVDPEGDMMNGFFVACFERDSAPAQVSESTRGKAMRCGDEQAALSFETAATLPKRDQPKKQDPKQAMPKKAEKRREPKRKRDPEPGPKREGPLTAPAKKKKKRRGGPGLSIKER